MQINMQDSWDLTRTREDTENLNAFFSGRAAKVRVPPSPLELCGLGFVSVYFVTFFAFDDKKVFFSGSRWFYPSPLFRSLKTIKCVFSL